MVFDEILKHPASFFLYYNLYINNNEELPPFIDRGKAKKVLIDLNLVKVLREKKHIHHESITLTQFGNHIGEKFTKSGYFKKFNGVKLNSREDFHSSFNKVFHPTLYESYGNSEILQALELPAIDQWMKRQGKYLLKIIGWKQPNPEMDNSFEFLLKIRCIQCEYEFEIFIGIIYNPEEYNTKSFTTNCPNCDFIFFTDFYFKNFDMYKS